MGRVPPALHTEGTAINEPLSAWTLLDRVEDFSRPLPEMQPRPYGALVVATDFGEIAHDRLWRLSVWLVVTGCSVAAFHGAQSARAEDNYDEATVIVKLALEGEIELQRAISEDWTRPLGESGAAHWGVGYLSTSHKPEEESLRETVVRGFLKSDPVQLPIAIPLDERSEAALRDVFGGEASELDAETGRADADGV